MKKKAFVKDFLSFVGFLTLLYFIFFVASSNFDFENVSITEFTNSTLNFNYSSKSISEKVYLKPSYDEIEFERELYLRINERLGIEYNKFQEFSVIAKRNAKLNSVDVSSPSYESSLFSIRYDNCIESQIKGKLFSVEYYTNGIRSGVDWYSKEELLDLIMNEWEVYFVEEDKINMKIKHGLGFSVNDENFAVTRYYCY